MVAFYLINKEEKQITFARQKSILLNSNFRWTL